MPHSRSPNTILTPTQPKSQPSQKSQASQASTKKSSPTSESRNSLVSIKRSYEEKAKNAYFKVRYACERGDLAHIKKKASKYPLMFPASQGLWGYLCIAASRGHLEIVKFLLENEPASLNMYDRNGYTPLQTAAIFDQLECVKLLIEAGADPMYETKAKPPRNAFQLACESGSRNVALHFLYILDFEAQGRRSSDGVLPLEYACRSMEIPEIVEHLLFVGDNLPRTDKGMCSFIPVIHESMDTLKLLAKHGADFNVTNSTGQTPLVSAARKGCHRAAIFLLRHGATLGFDEAVEHASRKKDARMLEILELYGPSSSAEPLSGSPGSGEFDIY